MRTIHQIDIELIDAFLAELSNNYRTRDANRRIDQLLDRRNELNQHYESISLRFDANKGLDLSSLKDSTVEHQQVADNK